MAFKFLGSRSPLLAVEPRLTGLLQPALEILPVGLFVCLLKPLIALVILNKATQLLQLGKVVPT